MPQTLRSVKVVPFKSLTISVCLLPAYHQQVVQATDGHNPPRCTNTCQVVKTPQKARKYFCLTFDRDIRKGNPVVYLRRLVL